MSKIQSLTPKLLLTAIFVLFLCTRLYKITEIPSSVYWDEASIGYNAYSIAETGKDEWGEFLPIHFRAFGEFKLPVYIYATVPFIKIFGLNAFSVRLPSVLFSLGSIILIFFLAKKISGSREVGIFSSFFVSISPWFFIFSRTGYEASAGLMFYLFGILFLLNKLTGKIFVISVISFIFSAYSYNSFRIIAPLSLLILVVFKIKEIKLLRRIDLIYIGLSILLIILSSTPILRSYIYDSGLSRFQAVSATPGSFIRNYLSHFSPDFLLAGDKNLRSQQTGLGQVYLVDLILFLVGTLYLLKSRYKYKLLPLLLLIISPIPASITKESPHALRTIAAIPFISIVSAAGVIALGIWVKKIKTIYLVVVFVYIIFFANYFLNFENIYPEKSANDWQYGYERIFTDYENEFPNYDRIIISNDYAQPYIFALFYQKIDPNEFMSTVIRASVDQWGFSTVTNFDKFIFTKVNFDKLPKGKNLVFAAAGEKLYGLTSKDVIFNLDNSIAFYVYEYNK